MTFPEQFHFFLSCITIIEVSQIYHAQDRVAVPSEINYLCDFWECFFSIQSAAFSLKNDILCKVEYIKPSLARNGITCVSSASGFDYNQPEEVGGLHGGHFVATFARYYRRGNEISPE